jgi:uroporphyrinogen-III synthase
MVLTAKAEAFEAPMAEPSPTLERRQDMTARVALFRAREDAVGSAARLRRLGFSVASLPAIEIKARPFQPRRSRYDAVVATSGKAFLGGGLADTSSPLYAVGARTGRAAEARGWRLAAPPARDAAGLIETLNGALTPGANVLYLTGRDRKGVIEAALKSAFALEVVETYAAEAREAWRPAEARALLSCVAALHYSRRSAGLAAALAKISGDEEHFLALEHVCLSRDVAEPIEAAGATRIAIAETPDEPALFRTFCRTVGGFPSLGASLI